MDETGPWVEATFYSGLCQKIDPETVHPSRNDNRCSGKNVCSFRLIQDHKPAESWGPGLVYVKYACMEGVNMSRYCMQDVVANDEGFLQTPAYPSYYVGQQECKWTVKSPPGQKVLLQLLDISLRGIGPREVNCTDHLTVVENDRTVLSTCGDEADLIQILSESNTLEVTITTASKKMFPKRGVLAHYKAIGCVHPSPPHDGYVIYRNETFGEYMCCVGYAFPDTLEKTRVLQCINNNTWNNTLPDCTNTSNSIWGPMRLQTDNNTDNEVTAVIKESDLMFDVLLPTVIICVLLVGNGVIIFVIYYLRKRKLPRHLDEEEVGAIYEPNEGSEKAISV
ncbi:uncharacterized protein [Anabrus simplex]|uniref:uncharacterized protein n=1 Tax=Anabrus simplex TaxID=316456 RepID=UPI0035A2DDFD